MSNQDTLLRYSKVRRADALDDQKTAAEVLAAEIVAETQEELQEFVLSQIKRIIFNGSPGEWNSDFTSAGIKSLRQLSAEGPAPGAGWIYVYQIEGRNGVVASNQTWQDAGNNVLQALTVSGNDLRVYVRASYPLVTVDGVASQLSRSPESGFYFGYVDITIAGTGDIQASVTSPDGAQGPHDTVQITVDAPPQVLDVYFEGGYPGTQTELKAGDTFTLHVLTDKACEGAEILDYEACQGATFTFASTTEFTISGTIADRGNVAVLRPARVRARDSAGAYGAARDTNFGGGTTDGHDVVLCNNLHPTVAFGSVTYPATQTALKNSESATVPVTVTSFDTILFSSPNAQLTVDAPTSASSPKTVHRVSGNYNVSVANLAAEAVRTANDAHTVAAAVVRIAHVAATVTVTEPYARLRAGAPAQDYTISIVSNQEIPAAPSLDSADSPNSGVLQGSGWVGGLLTFTRALRVSETDVPGTYSWRNLLAVNRAGIPTTTISGDSSYVIGGFVARTVTFAPFSQTASLGVAVTNYSKLTAGIFTATNQPSIRNPVQGNHDNLTNTYTIEAVGVNPTTVFWNDLAAANSNSTGTAQLLSIEEQV